MNSQVTHFYCFVWTHRWPASTVLYVLMGEPLLLIYLNSWVTRFYSFIRMSSWVTRFYWFIGFHDWPTLSCAGIHSCPVPHSWACSPSPTWGTLPSPPSRPGPTGQSNQHRTEKRSQQGKLPWSALQMKGRRKFNINVWFLFMYSQKWNCYIQHRIIMFCLLVPTLIYLWEIYIFPGSVCQFCCKEISGLILRIYKCGNWDWGRAIPRKGIHIWDFSCSVDRSGEQLICWYFAEQGQSSSYLHSCYMNHRLKLGAYEAVAD